MGNTTHKPVILFLCTGNACRSQMAEALLRHVAGGRFDVRSAGSHPAGFVHPIAIAAMEHLGVRLEGQYSKSWHEYADAQLDAVITLCDSAAATPCPVWPGSPVRAHWPLPDPSFHEGAPQERLDFALEVAERLRQKILALVALPWGTAPPEELATRLAALADG